MQTHTGITFLIHTHTHTQDLSLSRSHTHTNFSAFLASMSMSSFCILNKTLFEPHTWKVSMLCTQSNNIPIHCLLSNVTLLQYFPHINSKTAQSTDLWSTKVNLPSTLWREINSVVALGPMRSLQLGVLVTWRRPMATRQQWLPLSSPSDRSICTPGGGRRLVFVLVYCSCTNDKRSPTIPNVNWFGLVVRH